MSDMKKKIGKQGLNGLLNRKEPEPEPLPRNSWDGGYQGSIWDDDDDIWDDDDDYGASGSFQAPASRRFSRGSTRTTVTNPVNKPGQRGGKVNFTTDGDIAVIGDNELRRMALEVTENLRRSIEYRGFSVTLHGDAELMEFAKQFITGSCRVVSNGRLMRIAVEEE